MTTSSQVLSRFDHITIVARAIDSATQSYASLLGHAPTWRGAHPELGTESALFGLSNSLIEITAPRANAEESEGLRGWLDVTGGGLQALALGTDDAASCSKVLRERGVRATPPQAGEARGDDGATRQYQTVELSPRVTLGTPVLIVERPDFAALTSATNATADCVHALDHVVIRTANIEATKAAYSTALGLRLALERDINGARMLFFRVGGVTLEVIEDTNVGDTNAFYGATYRVRDLVAAHARVQAAGFAISEIREGHKPGTTVFTVRDGTHNVPTLMLCDPSRG